MGTKLSILLLFIITARQISFSQVNLTNGLVAYYPFNGNTNDASGNNLHATIMGGAISTADRFGNNNNAWAFDGIDDYLRVADNGAFSTSSMSIAFWFKTEALRTQVLIGKREWTSQNNSEFGITLYPSSQTVRSFMVSNNRNCNDPVVSSTSQSIQANYQQANCHTGWHHVVATFANGVHKLYLDGQLLSSTPANFNSRSMCNTELRFGVWWRDDPNWFKGALDEIRWYNRSLNDQEVAALYDNYSPSDPLKLDFTFQQDACDPKQIKFTPSTNNMNNPTWYFGDGNSTSASAPIHNYSGYGNYLIKLKGQNSLGCFDSVQKTISVNNKVADTLIRTSDTSICSGSSITIDATTFAPKFCWQSSSGPLNNNSTSISVAPVSDTVFYFTGQVYGPNLITNPNFSQGNTGFTTDYSFANPNVTEGQYWIGTSSNSWNGAMSNCTDHTTGSGNMLMINGSPLSGTKVWSQTVPVASNTNYSFAFWLQTLHSTNPAQLKISINNIVLGDNILAGATPCQWKRFESVWNSGNQTTAVLTIINNNTAAGGNDFALDDLLFSKVEMLYDSIKILVSPAPNVRTGNDTTICANVPFQLSATGAHFYTWTPATGLSDPSVSNPIATISATTQYIVTGWNTAGGCVSRDTMTVNVSTRNLFSITPANLELCAGSNISLLATGGHLYNWFTDTNPNLSTTNQIISVATASGTFYVAINDTICNYRDTLKSVVFVKPNPVVSLSKTNDVDCSVSIARLHASGGDNYYWRPDPTIISINSSTVSVSPNMDTWYKVHVSKEGCSAEDSILIKVNFEGAKNKLYIPTAFTPNKDGKNEFFRPAVSGPVSKYEFNIFNRWGELVFRTNDPTRGWDGTFKGIDLPTGVYVYWLKANGICTGETFRKGTITLIR